MGLAVTILLVEHLYKEFDFSIMMKLNRLSFCCCKNNHSPPDTYISVWLQWKKQNMISWQCYQKTYWLSPSKCPHHAMRIHSTFISDLEQDHIVIFSAKQTVLCFSCISDWLLWIQQQPLCELFTQLKPQGHHYSPSKSLRDWNWSS